MDESNEARQPVDPPDPPQRGGMLNERQVSKPENEVSWAHRPVMGDSGEQGKTYRDWLEGLSECARRYARKKWKASREVARDIALVVMADIDKRRREGTIVLSGATSIIGYVYRAVDTRMMNAKRHQQSRPNLVSIDEVETPVLEDAMMRASERFEPPESGPRELAIRVALEKAFGTLSPECLRIFELVRVKQMTQKEAARATGKAYATVKRQLEDANKHIRAVLTKLNVLPESQSPPTPGVPAGAQNMSNSTKDKKRGVRKAEINFSTTLRNMLAIIFRNLPPKQEPE